MPRKTFVCLAKSWRPGGYCFAGREYDNGQIGSWLRPISFRDDNAVWDSECRYQNGSIPKPLDIVRFEIKGHCPDGVQSENCYFDSQVHWEKVGSFSKSHLISICDEPDSIWGVGQSSVNGLNDKVLCMFGPPYTNSLLLIHSPEGKVVKQKEYINDEEKIRLRLEFSYGGSVYLLSLKDSQYSYDYKSKEFGEYRIGPCCVTVSLTKPYKDGYCYKIAAALFRA